MSAEPEQSRHVQEESHASGPPFATGTLLAARYRLVQLLPGRSPVVYQAHDEALDRDVALYLIPPQRPDLVALARDTAQIKHACYLRVFSLGVEHDWTFLVVEWQPADTLAQILALGRPAPASVAARVGVELAGAIEAAHDQALSHPPLAPTAILFYRSGPVRFQPTSEDVLSPDHTLREDAQALALLLRTLLTAGGQPAPATPLLTLLTEASSPAASVQRPAELAIKLRSFLTATGSPASAAPAPAENTTLKLNAVTPPGQRPSENVPVARWSAGVAQRPGANVRVARPISGGVGRVTLGERLQPLRRQKPAALAAAALALVLLLALFLFQPTLHAYLAPAPYCARGAVPHLSGDLAELQSKIGSDVVGTVQECPHANEDNGDLLQQTSTGLAFVRKSSGAAIFTNGFDHWAISKGALVYWTGASVDPPAGAATVPGLPGAIRPDATSG